MSKRFVNNPIRRSQLISPFGVGAIVDFPNDISVMIAGLDDWIELDATSDNSFHEERLQSLLGVSNFRLPPDYEKSGESIPSVRFPLWHYCRSCHKMEKISLYRSDKKSFCKFCDKDYGKKRRLVPVRFVTVCSEGHISDFPFNEWAHRYGKGDGICSYLKYTAGTSSTLAGVRISCSCGQGSTLHDAFDKKVFDRMNLKCKGHKPWLKLSDADYGCGNTIETSQKGSSNIYFPVVHSSIYLPLWGEKYSADIIEVLENPMAWGMISSNLEEGEISRDACDMWAKMYKLSSNAFYEAAVAKYRGNLSERPMNEKDFRYAEYEAFLNERGTVESDLYVTKEVLSNYDQWITDFFSNVVLVHKLRETRAFSGFTRLIPSGERASADSGKVIEPMDISKGVDWLPAIIVRGEGIFLEFSRESLDQWLNVSDAESNISDFMDRFNQSRTRRGLLPVERSPEYILLHTFAHMLIRQLCFDCGYGSAALRERIYYSQANEDEKGMNGVLIYTAAGDSEGTMGGLVRAGEAGNLENTIRRALQNAIWCSGDPVCSESKGQGTGNANLAACHNCVLLPETSCEEGNRFLDRKLVVGGVEDRGLGLFSKILGLV